MYKEELLYQKFQKQKHQKQQNIINPEQGIKRIGIYYIAHQIKIENLIKKYKQSNITYGINKEVICFIIKDLPLNYLNLSEEDFVEQIQQQDNEIDPVLTYARDSKLKFMFLYKMGTIVFWNFTENEELNLIKLFKNEYIEPVNQYITDKIGFIEHPKGKGHTTQYDDFVDDEYDDEYDHEYDDNQSGDSSQRQLNRNKNLSYNSQQYSPINQQSPKKDSIKQRKISNSSQSLQYNQGKQYKYSYESAGTLQEKSKVAQSPLSKNNITPKKEKQEIQEVTLINKIDKQESQGSNKIQQSNKVVPYQMRKYNNSNSIMKKKSTSNRNGKQTGWGRITDYIDKEVLKLQTTDLEEKITVSQALGQSVKLENQESQLQELLDEHYDKIIKLGRQELSAQKKRSYKQFLAEMLKRILQTQKENQKMTKTLGQILLAKRVVNLESRFIETPSYVEDDEDLELIYQKVQYSFDLPERLEIQNNKLNAVNELFEDVRQMRRQKYMFNIEYLVILIMCTQVFLAILKGIFQPDHYAEIL